MGITALRARIAHLTGDPGDDRRALEYFDDGLLVLDDGHVAEIGPTDDIRSKLPAGLAITARPEALIVPGLIDCHVHYAQLDMIASYGEQLLHWLDRYAYPAEMRFADAAHAAEVAEAFLDELLKCGTTTAMVFATVHPQSVHALFSSARARNMRLMAGKVLMDRHCPPALQDSPQSGIADSTALIERWHGQGRLSYAVTPRFAPTSSPRQLALAGQLAAQHDGVYVHTHLAENTAEIALVEKLFPDRENYLDVYRHYGLVGERSVFAHGVHLHDHERALLADSGAALAFCPGSNLFLGSGLFDLASARQQGVHVGLGTDIGAGTDLCLLRTAADAYRVSQLRGHSVPAAQALYLATLGGARALRVDHLVGNFQPGKEADFILLDPAATPLLKRRTAQTRDIDELLFALIMMGDDRAVAETWVMGERVWSRD